MQVRLNLAQVEDIPKTWIILDTGSGANCANSPDILNNIRSCRPGEDLTVLTNGGSQYFNLIGDMKMFPLKLHYNVHSLANILSFDSLATTPGVRITVDTKYDKVFRVTYNDRSYEFKGCGEGIYYYDTAQGATDSCPTMSLVQTVKENKQFFTKKEIEGAEESRRLQQLIGWPSTTTFKRIVAQNMLRNCPITVDDILRAEAIFGKPTPLCKGKMTKISSSTIKLQKIPLPLPISQYHQRIQLYIDIFFVNRVPFFHTKSGKINFITSQALYGRSARQIIDGLNIVQQIYKNRGFIITDIHGDNEFDKNKLREHIMPTNLQICAADEHVPIVERSIRTLKERARSGTHSIPYKRYPRIMTVALVESMTTWLNAFPTTNGISSTMSPAAIVIGKHNPDMSRKRINFGAYAMVHIGTTNTMKRRSVPSIALRESNENGGYFFMSLHTGKRLHSNKWDELPIDDEIIKAVENIAEEQGQPLLPDQYPMFEWAPGNLIDDGDYDDEETEENDDNNEHRYFMRETGDHLLFDEDDEKLNDDNEDKYDENEIILQQQNNNDEHENEENEEIAVNNEDEINEESSIEEEQFIREHDQNIISNDEMSDEDNVELSDDSNDTIDDETISEDENINE